MRASLAILRQIKKWADISELNRQTPLVVYSDGMYFLYEVQPARKKEAVHKTRYGNDILTRSLLQLCI